MSAGSLGKIEGGHERVERVKAGCDKLALLLVDPEYAEEWPLAIMSTNDVGEYQKGEAYVSDLGMDVDFSERLEATYEENDITIGAELDCEVISQEQMNQLYEDIRNGVTGKRGEKIAHYLE